MSRSRADRQSKRGFDKCICGHYQPCPILDPLHDRRVRMMRDHRERRHDDIPDE